jgi:hypothetical protein
MDNLRRFNIIDGYEQTSIEIDGDDGEFCVYSDIAQIIAERDTLKANFDASLSLLEKVKIDRDEWKARAEKAEREMSRLRELPDRPNDW